MRIGEASPALRSLIASWLQVDYCVLYIQPRNVCGTLLAACFVI